MPAAWIIPAGGVRGCACAGVDGSLWSGVCTALTVRRTLVGDVSWELHPWRLLLGELAVHIAVTRGAGNLDAEVELRFGQRVTVRQARADLPLDPALIPGLPAALRSEEHTSELQSQSNLVCRLLLEKKKTATPYSSALDLS